MFVCVAIRKCIALKAIEKSLHITSYNLNVDQIINIFIIISPLNHRRPRVVVKGVFTLPKGPFGNKIDNPHQKKWYDSTMSRT